MKLLPQWSHYIRSTCIPSRFVQTPLVGGHTVLRYQSHLGKQVMPLNLVEGNIVLPHNTSRSFTTTILLSLAPSGPPRNVIDQAQNSSTLFLSWEPPLFEEQNGIIREYVVSMSELNSGRKWEFTATNTTATVPFLHPTYTYLCTVAAVTVERGPASEPLSVTVGEGQPPFTDYWKLTVIALHHGRIVIFI